jgi:hypothetical protein
MYGYNYAPNYFGPGYQKPTGATYPALTMATQPSLARWLGAPAEPAYQMKHDYGNQNSTNLHPLGTNYVPVQTGLFGPLFGFQTPENGCSAPYAVAPNAQDNGPGAYGLDPMTSAGNTYYFPKTPSNSCPIIMNIPYN